MFQPSEEQASGSLYKVPPLGLPMVETASCDHFCIPCLTLLAPSLLLPPKSTCTNTLIQSYFKVISVVAL